MKRCNTQSLLLVLVFVPECHTRWVRERLVIDSVSKLDRVVVFARDIPGTKMHYSFSDPPMAFAPPPFHNYSISHALSRKTILNYTCVFSTNGENSSRITTLAMSVAYQTVTCHHPKEPAIWLGGLVTIAVDGVLMSSRASYKEPVRPVVGQKKLFCACLLMWYRAEFLLEWLLYHTAVHGLSKVYIYDNDSTIDNLKAAVKWLSHIFDVEYVAWPVHKTQVAYHGHCALRAGLECEWVSFTDVDEFLHVGKANTVSSSLTSLLKRTPQHIGGLEIQMIQMRGNDTIRKPDGAVVHNYDCRTRVTNVKSIVRPHALHPSLATAVHHYTYADGFTPTRFYLDYPHVANMPAIYHFQTQAWEVYMRKYMRRASPASTAFKSRATTWTDLLAQPSQKWLNLTRKTCWKRDNAPSRTFRAAFSIPPQSLDCDSRNRENCIRALISGTASLGSGLYTAQKALQPASVRAVLPWDLQPYVGANARMKSPTGPHHCDITQWQNNTSIGQRSFMRYTNLKGGAYACCMKCVAELDCAAWVMSGRHCWLKDVVTQGVPKSNTVSGLIMSKGRAATEISPMFVKEAQLPPVPLIHHVREPLQAISALVLAPQERWRTMSRFDEREIGKGAPVSNGTTRIAKALHHWVLWNRLLELVSTSRMPFETTDYRSLCQNIVKRDCTRENGRPSCFSAAEFCTLTAASPHNLPGKRERSRENLTWASLIEIDPYLAQQAAEMAARYGYGNT